jgi:hypothetical protein
MKKIYKKEKIPISGTLMQMGSTQPLPHVD